MSSGGCATAARKRRLPAHARQIGRILSAPGALRVCKSEERRQ
jgi:hypothetical protein